jgi:hypothetical protein
LGLFEGISLVCFRRTVHAIVEGILLDQQNPAGRDDAAKVTDFIVRLHALMPDYLRWPVVLLTFEFDIAPVFFAGRPFHRLSPERRRRRLLSWKKSRLQVKQDFLRLYESLAIFAWASEAYV